MKYIFPLDTIKRLKVLAGTDIVKLEVSFLLHIQPVALNPNSFFLLSKGLCEWR